MEQHNEIEYKRPFFDGANHSVTMEDGEKVVLEPFEDLSNRVFVKCDLSRLSLTSCNFSGCQFIGCQAEYTDFSHSDFTGAIFINSNFSGSAFLWGTLYQAQFRDCNLDVARFNNAKMQRIQFDTCTLKKSQFKDSVLTKSLFKKCMLDSCFMSKSDIRNSTFEEVSAKEQQWLLSAVDLSGSKFFKCYSEYLGAVKCVFKYVFFDQSNLWKSKFHMCTFAHSLFVHTGFNESKFKKCLLISCEFEACRLRLTNFDGSIFEQNKIAISSLESSDFSSSIILSMELVDNYDGIGTAFPYCY